MKELIAFDLDGTLAESKQPLGDAMGQAIAQLLGVAHVAVISGGDWPQFDKQVASRLPAKADLSRLWLMPTTGTKLYTHSDGAWSPVYAELFDEASYRFSGAAFARQLGTACGGGATPLIAASLLSGFNGNVTIVAIYYAAVCVIALIAVAVARETRARQM